MGKTLTGTYTSGYSLTNPSTQNPLTISSTGLIDGIFGNDTTTWTIANYGTVESLTGVGITLIGDQLTGGLVTNGQIDATAALIEGGRDGVEIGAAITAVGTGTVVNFGTIVAAGDVLNSGTVGYGVYLSAGGVVTNGASGATGALIEGASTGVQIGGLASGGQVSNAGTVVNFGTIAIAAGVVTNYGGNGVYLFAGGAVTNGASTSPGALIEGTSFGVHIGGLAKNAGTVVNFGTIAATGTFGGGVFLVGGEGVVINGASGSTTALIAALQNGVAIGGSPGSVVNFGTIVATGTAGVGVGLSSDGFVSNGGSGLISGASVGIGISGSVGTVANLGTIVATGAFGTGIDLSAGGTIKNGSPEYTTSYIGGVSSAIKIYGGAGIVDNLGTIRSTSQSAIYDFPGGTIVNGAPSISSSLVESEDRAAISIADGVIVNYATIASASTVQVAVQLDGGTIVNASALSVIAGDGIGIIDSPGEIINSGTISGTFVGAGTVGGNGIVFEIGGMVVNETSGLISGYQNGIGFLLPGTIANPVIAVVNYGTISSTGKTGTGVNLQKGGDVRNGASGSTTALVIGYQSGVFVTGGTATIANYGTIEAIGTAGYGVHVNASGGVATVTNYGTISTTGANAVQLSAGGLLKNFGVISSSSTTGPAAGIAGSAGATFVNYGLIASLSTDHSGVSDGAGGIGMVINAAGATIASGDDAVYFQTFTSFATLVNSGKIQGTGTTAGSAIDIGHGAIVTNEASGLITAYRKAIAAYNTSATIDNFGTIQSTGTSATGNAVQLGEGGNVINNGFISGTRTGVDLDTAGTVLNSGTIGSSALTSFTAGYGANLHAGGLVSNQSGGLITAYRDAVSFGVNATTITNVAGTVMNAGTVIGGIGVAIGGNDAGNNTIINSGTIIGTAGTAISLGTTGTDLVVISSTAATLQGVVANVYPGDTFDLPFLASSGGHATVVSNGSITNQLQVVENAGTFAINLDSNQNFSGDVFQVGTDGSGGTLISESVEANGRFLFSAAEPVNLQLTPDGSNLPPAVAGDFNLEIFTTTNGTLASGYQGSAFAPGGTVDANGNVDAASITLGPGTFEVIDVGGNDSITAGSGSDSVVGGAGDTIIGGTGALGGTAVLDVIAGVQNTVLIGSGVASDTVDVTKGFSLVALGIAGGNVFADTDPGASDTVNAGPGLAAIVFGANLTIGGTAGTDTYTVQNAAGATLTGAAANVAAVGGSGDTISLGGVTNATVNALAGPELVNLGSGANIGYGGNGDTVNAGSGMVSAVGPATETLTLDGTASGTTYTVASAVTSPTTGGTMSGSAADVYIGLGGVVGDTVKLGAVTSATVQANQGGELVNLGSGQDTVFASGSDTVNAGSGSSLVQTPNGEAVTVSGASAATFAVDWAHNGKTVSISGTAATINAVGVAGDTISAIGSTATVNALAGSEAVQAGGVDTVFGAANDSIGVAPATTTVSGSMTFIQADSTVSVGFGTFDSLTGSSTAQATVGTIKGGVATDGFNTATDFVFYQNENITTTDQIIASGHATSVDGVASTIISLPDGSTMTLLGVTNVAGLIFK